MKSRPTRLSLFEALMTPSETSTRRTRRYAVWPSPAAVVPGGTDHDDPDCLIHNTSDSASSEPKTVQVADIDGSVLCHTPTVQSDEVRTSFVIREPREKPAAVSSPPKRAI